MKAAVLALVLFASSAEAGLERYRSLVVADDTHPSRPAAGGVRVTYLGVNGYQLEAGEHALLIDPYFSRVGLAAVALQQPIAPHQGRIAGGLQHVRRRVEAVLVTHAHFDHLLDVPEIMRRTSARLVAGPTAANLVQAVGIARARCLVVQPGEQRRISTWTITVLAAQHDRVFGSRPPFGGTVSHPAPPPRTASDWKLGEPLAFLIAANGQRIYIDSGGAPGGPPLNLGRIDLAIISTALPDSRRRFAATVRALQPRVVLPSHQDDFFAPYDRGFAFGKLTNFPQVLHSHRQEQLPGRLILLDYFRPWTLRSGR
ncbi:hypothetical protein BH20VER1_BH20VER1_18890 [soil metagenome]